MVMVSRGPQCRSFGETVRFHRGLIGYSQEELANRAGIHRTYIGGIERGERNPTLTMIHRLAIALGVPPSRLLEPVPKSIAGGEG